MQTAMETEVLGVRIRRRTRREALEILRRFLAGGATHSVYFVHAATANLAFEDASYRDVINRGHLVLNDGIGMRLATRSSGVVLNENLLGTDLIPLLFREPFTRLLRVFLLGGRPGVIERAAARIAEQYLQVQVVGTAHGYFASSEEPAIVERIHRLQPDLLLVGLGNPRQEQFIDRHLAELGCRVAAGVGGLFDHFAGELRRASPWVRQWGLEWCQLLIQQPHKWRRYLLGNPKFLWRAFRGRALGAARQGAVAALSFAIAIAAAEAAVRLIRPQTLERHPESLYVASSTRQYKLRPHFHGVFRYPEFQTEVRISGQGLREDREYSPAHPSVRRVLALGDSFTMGYSVEQPRTWVRVLERLLNQGARYEVINAGVPGYSTRQELVYLEEEGMGLRPDVVLLGFFLGNDITDNALPALPVELLGGRLISAGARSGLLPFACRLALARHSHLYQLVQRSGRAFAGADYAVYGGQAESGWQATAGLIDRLARRCAARGVRLIVLLMPEKIQVESAARPRAAMPDLTLPNRRMRALCREAGVEAIDLLDALTRPGGQAQPALYFPQDGHWTPEGNAIAARATFDYLRHDPQ